MTAAPFRASVRLHLTNVAGIGASQLLQSLLPALESDLSVNVERMDLPDRGSLSTYRCSRPETVVNVHHRRLPNALSRLLECTCLAGRFDGDSPLLVFGDLPLRCRGPQTVFVQNSNLLRPQVGRRGGDALKYRISRYLFRLSKDRVRAFIVQTEVMREALEQSYPGVAGRVYVIPQPVPSWLLQSGLRRAGRTLGRKTGEGLRLIYPAAGYPHKNHGLLSRLDAQESWPVERLTLTLEIPAHPAPNVPWITCSGFLSPQAMVEAYSQVDALLFLSKDESYGFPLVEAMFVGLPIVCPDLPYARTLCGQQAIYFDPDLPASLHHALRTLQYQLGAGWWPDWQDRLSGIPLDWETVASRMLAVACHRDEQTEKI